MNPNDDIALPTFVIEVPKKSPYLTRSEKRKLIAKVRREKRVKKLLDIEEVNKQKTRDDWKDNTCIYYRSCPMECRGCLSVCRKLK